MSQNQAHNCGAPDPTSPPLAASLEEQLASQLLRKHEDQCPSIAAPAASSLGGLARGMGVQGAGSLGLACRDGSGIMCPCFRAQDLVGYQLYRFPNSPGTNSLIQWVYLQHGVSSISGGQYQGRLIKARCGGKMLGES